MEYDRLQPITVSTRLDLCRLSFPLTVKYVKHDATTETVTYVTPEQVEVPSHKYFAYMVERPHRVQMLVEKIRDQGIKSTMGLVQYLDQRGMIKWPEDEKVETQPIAPRLDTFLRANRHLSPNVIEGIKKWFNDPAMYPEVHGVDLGNTLIAIKPSGAGRAVVLPTGHSMAYTDARDLALELLANVTNNYRGGVMDSVKVGEYFGHREGYRYGRKRIQRKGHTIVIGCQTIPISAIRSLAEDENWI